MESVEEKLDNAAWHALAGPHAELAEEFGCARVYPRDVAFFAAVDALDAEGWQSLGRVAEERELVVLFRADIGAVPDAYAEVLRIGCLQMTAPPALAELAGPDFEPLGAADVDEMLALVQLTEPGPFLPRTVEMGRYVGVRDAGRLVAMGGERLRADGASEISAICTHPDARGRGLASYLTTAVGREIQARGELAFLHVAEDNTPAIRLYEKLGFKVRRRVDVVGFQRRSDAAPS